MIKIYKSPKEIDFKPDDVFLHFTGNIFGIGCMAFSEKAKDRILRQKQRDENKGFILLFHSIDHLKSFAFPQLQNQKIFNLLNQYLPGNLTIILHTEQKCFEKVWQNNKCAVRIPKSKLLRDFIKQLGQPIVSTSINVSGNPFCTDLKILLKEFSEWFDYGLYDEREEADQPLPSTLLDIVEVMKKESPSTPSKSQALMGGIMELQIKCLREGSIPFSEIKSSFNKPLIQFVCIGNICRSPMAEYYAAKRFEEEKLPYRVSSCGLIEFRKLISDNSKAVLNKNGIGAVQRFSVPVDDTIVRSSFLLLCMSKDVKRHLVDKFPEAKNKIFTFAEYTGNVHEIDDPYGLDYVHFEKAFELIKKYTEDLINELRIRN